MSEGEDSDWYKLVNEEDLVAEEEDGGQPSGSQKELNVTLSKLLSD